MLQHTPTPVQHRLNNNLFSDKSRAYTVEMVFSSQMWTHQFRFSCKVKPYFVSNNRLLHQQIQYTPTAQSA